MKSLASSFLFSINTHKLLLQIFSYHFDLHILFGHIFIVFWTFWKFRTRNAKNESIFFSSNISSKESKHFKHARPTAASNQSPPKKRAWECFFLSRPAFNLHHRGCPDMTTVQQEKRVNFLTHSLMALGR